MSVSVSKKKAPEGASYVLDITFKDEDGDLVVPNAGLNWTLTDTKGTVVNGRSGVTVSPDSEISVVLDGADLATDGYFSLARKFLISGDYASTLGTLKLRKEVTFYIDDFSGVS